MIDQRFISVGRGRPADGSQRGRSTWLRSGSLQRIPCAGTASGPDGAVGKAPAGDERTHAMIEWRWRRRAPGPPLPLSSLFRSVKGGRDGRASPT